MSLGQGKTPNLFSSPFLRILKMLRPLTRVGKNLAPDETIRENEKPQVQRPLLAPPLEVSCEALKEILDAHRKWVESGGTEGKRANLSGANLQGRYLADSNLEGANLGEANLREANLVKANLRKSGLLLANLEKSQLASASLQEANLWSAKLSGAFLPRANLQDASLLGANLSEAQLEKAVLEGVELGSADLTRANLREANLKKANLLRTRLREADLQDADLTGATGLLGGQLAGANVSGAKLPDAILKFEGLANVQEASKSTSKLFISMLLGCVYSWLTIGTTTDAGLLTNTASSPLPLTGTSIPIVGFYWVAPLILLGTYFYLHLYLQRLWEALADLPAVFPDGRPLDKTAYPWLLNGIVRTYFARLRDDRPPLFRLQTGISIILAWWVVPMTLFVFWLRYLRRHDWPGTALHILLLVIAMLAAIVLQRLSAATLRGDDRQPFFWRRFVKDARVYKGCALALGIGVTFTAFSMGAVGGVPSYEVDRLSWLERESLSRVGRITERGPLSTEVRLKPWNIRIWVPHAFEIIGYRPFANLDYQEVSVRPPEWTGQKDQFALVKGANLNGRDLRFASGRGAFLVKADLQEATLWRASLAEADLREAKLTLADLREADLCVAKLERAELRSAKLHGALLLGAHLAGADLTGANLSGAVLVGADLRNTRLEGADLRKANMGAADLGRSNLKKTDLRGLDLRYTNGLSRHQIKAALTDAGTRLPGYLKEPRRETRVS